MTKNIDNTKINTAVDMLIESDSRHLSEIIR